MDSCTAFQPAAHKPPFPWFGGKSRVAPLVWERFGRVPNYVEPFFGSGAVLFGRPSPVQGIETVNDKDGFLANFWRAAQSDPEGLAEHADWPVNENDLHARHAWLVARRAEFTERLTTDPDFYDVKIAGWWVWGLCQWIGSGWCQASSRKRPHLVGRMGVHRKRPHLVGRMGVHCPSRQWLDYFRSLQTRLRHVRVCSGDWSRICGPSPTEKNGLTAVFLDPPYCAEDRANLYTEESFTVAKEVEAWCLENQDNPLLRIALCGYAGDYDLPDWTAVPWKAPGGYGNQSDVRGADNAHREMLWFSPHCLGGMQASLFS